MDCSVFQYIGIFTSLYFIVKIVLKIIEGSRLYIFSTYPDFSKFGKWSVVTGSTDGIGKATAFQLASYGQNIVLISRNEEKLRNVANEIESKHNVQTKCLTIDFSDDEEIYDKIADFLQGLDIGTLVNNVGIAQEISCFHEHPNLTNLIRHIIRINIMSVVKMTQVVLPGMVRRKRGLILNVASMAAVRPIQIMTMYSATKTFINFFSQGLSYEYESKGITIQSCMPGTVRSNMTEKFSEVQKMPTAEQYCKSWLATVGKARWTHGYWKHAIEAFIMRQLPSNLFHKMVGSSLKSALKAANEKKNK
ncbi:very-long-chain 3-oxoacyl-CoA reductase-like [Clavelina lepadiformis]|uniref:very-long-chain 3-oxoacyl-CoA reductase-like n=1 Tax=Clavelina lepadiformis TaxID=159417 RepID=UPI00404197A4